MGKEFSQDLPKIGYLYHYPALGHPTDKFRLDIFISDMPTGKHFDVLRVYLIAEQPNGELERLKISHPWYFENSYRICGGKVIMEDRKGKKVEAFSFGGQLTIHVKEMQTECILVSPAPILEISENTPLQVLFIEELELLLAEYRAENPNGHDFELHLCDADPFSLYIACIKELIEKFKLFPDKDEKYLQFLTYLQKEEHRLHAAGLLYGPIPRLEDIFNE
ncbi:MAG: hypothetical protein WBB69_14000 [Anaerolineales bacterium]